MPEFKELFNKLLEQKPELTRDHIEKMIKQKKTVVGSGYLTDQGALFLVASDLDVKLTEPLKIEMNLKELYIGAREITLEARVMCISPIKQFLRKDGTMLRLRTMIIYDKYATATVKMWNEKVDLETITNLKPGEFIKITKAYIKSDINGNPVINIGSGSNININKIQCSIPTLDLITKDVSSIKESREYLSISGCIDRTIQTIKFVNSRGQQSKALKLSIKGPNNKLIKVILWGKDEYDLPKIVPINAKTTLIGVKTRPDKYKNIEIHGNESTTIKVDGKYEKGTMLVKILSVLENNMEENIALCIDETKDIFKIKDITDKINYEKDDTIEFIPSKIYGNTIILDNNSFVKIKYSDVVIDPRTKIADIVVGKEYCVESIVLKVSDESIIHTRTGESIPMSEMFMEDDSGHIWIKGWRKQADLINRCSVGDIISIIGVGARSGLDGKTELFLTKFSSIDKKN